MASSVSKLVFLLVRIQQYGVYLNAQAYEDKGRGQTDSPKTVDVFVEYIGVVTTASAHEYKAYGYKCKTDEKEGVVLFLKNKFLRDLFACLFFLFLTHAANLTKFYLKKFMVVKVYCIKGVSASIGGLNNRVHRF